MNEQYAGLNKTGRILVADDDYNTCNFLKTLLATQLHTVIVVSDGKAALEVARRELPDVLLLDLRMPEINGTEVYRSLKSDPVTAAIRVIIITGYDDRDTRLEGIKAGADDFLTKPVDSEEVLLRVRNAINMKYLFDKVKEDYEKLQKLEEMQKRLIHMILHDMRTPLMSLITGLEMLAFTDVKKNKEQVLNALDAARTASRELIEMANSMLDISRMESGKMPLTIRACSIGELVKDAIHVLKPMFGVAKIVLDEPSSPKTVWCDGDIIRRVIINLLSNALKAQSFRGMVNITIREEGGNIRISVIDEGAAIPPEYHQKIFERFGEVEIGRKLSSSIGLGLPFCKMAVEAHGGSIRVENNKVMGNTFTVLLPMHLPVPAA